ncbi:hypothetical protein [Rhodococcus sp. NPDC060176]|uniref:hypothetical protein n=1 Tax=Rhodococcus sp. NPDC060176 TaxID=3347062 RepID=UPI00366650EB
MTDDSADQIARELRLTPDEMFTLRTLQARMLRLDWEHERREGDARTKKRDRLRSFVATSIQEILASEATTESLAQELAAIEHSPFFDQLNSLTKQGSTLAGKVGRRSTSVVILAELITFSPWTDGTTWGSGVRRSALHSAAHDLTALRENDLDAMTTEFESLMKALRRKSIKWGASPRSQ